MDADDGWGAAVDLDAFLSTTERINLALKKTDDTFYGVVFASKGTTMIQNSYNEAYKEVERSLSDFDTVLRLLGDAKAPGL